MNLPIQLTQLKDLMLMQTKWASILNAVIGNPSIQSAIISNIPLLNSKPTIINHLLGRKLIGWRVIRIRAAASIFDQQDSNQTPQLTLVLFSNVAVTVDLEVF